jgi:hypothetical protein
MHPANRYFTRVLALLAAGSLATSTLAETTTIRPTGEYARIDTGLANDTIAALGRGTPAQKRDTVERVTASPERYAPPVFYALSRALFVDGKRDEGAFWFYAGQLRGRFDANRCADVSARQAVAVLNDEYGGEINRHAFQDLDKLEALIPKVVEWDRKTPHQYDHRWINLHGMQVVLGDQKSPLSLPTEQWETIAEQTRTDYLSGFRNAMTGMRNRK